MLQYNTIATDDDKIRLTCLIEDGKPCMVSLDFYEDGYPEAIWDNDKYLFNTLYPFLKRFVKGDILITDRKEFMKIWDEDLIKELLEIFEEAIKQKWNDYKSSK